MALGKGTLLGSYEILSSIGKGGMGEVYRARDSKLGRDVAIKILPEDFAQDPERLGRFQREAHLLASLNHPNIGAIYDLGDANGTKFFVLELVPGETLADLIVRGPVPVDESLAICRQIADALETAHDKGITTTNTPDYWSPRIVFDSHWTIGISDSSLQTNPRITGRAVRSSATPW